jgi:Peptidase_C39 like family
MSITLTVLTSTVLKRKPVQSSVLPDDQKQSIAAGQTFELSAFALERDHVRCTFTKEAFKDIDTGYFFGGHVEIRQAGKLVYPKTIPDQIKLEIPYKSQRDNEFNPDGSCNVTSLAMCLTFLGAPRQTEVGQFEDELYDYAERNTLSRHDPHDLAVIVEAYGCRDDFRTDATIEQVKEWLAAGKPIVVHGYFTDFGHIVVFAGYDETGFLVHDPYGEWNSWGYLRNEFGISDAKGEFIHYSYDMITQVCMPDESFWVHFIRKP